MAKRKVLRLEERSDKGGKHKSTKKDRRKELVEQAFSDTGLGFTMAEMVEAILTGEGLDPDRFEVVKVYSRRLVKELIQEGKVKQHGGGRGDKDTYYEWDAN